MGEILPNSNLQLTEKLTYTLPNLAPGVSFWIFSAKNNWGTPTMPVNHAGRYTREHDTFTPPDTLVLTEGEEFKLGVIIDTPNLGSFNVWGYSKQEATQERKIHDETIAILLQAGLTIEKEDLATWDTSNPTEKIIRTRFWLTDRNRFATNDLGWTVNHVWKNDSANVAEQVWY